VIGQDYIEIGQARIQSVMENMSYGHMIEDVGDMTVEPRQRAITR